jgi:hypothetical protein
MNMKRFLAVFSSVALVACITDPTPGRSMYCQYRGDTIGLGPLLQPDSTIIACLWVLEIDAQRCYTAPVKLLSQATTPCVVGTKWIG